MVNRKKRGRYIANQIDIIDWWFEEAQLTRAKYKTNKNFKSEPYIAYILNLKIDILSVHIRYIFFANEAFLALHFLYAKWTTLLVGSPMDSAVEYANYKLCIRRSFLVYFCKSSSVHRLLAGGAKIYLSIHHPFPILYLLMVRGFQWVNISKCKCYIWYFNFSLNTHFDYAFAAPQVKDIRDLSVKIYPN